MGLKLQLILSLVATGVSHQLAHRKMHRFKYIDFKILIYIYKVVWPSVFLRAGCAVCFSHDQLAFFPAYPKGCYRTRMTRMRLPL